MKQIVVFLTAWLAMYLTGWTQTCGPERFSLTEFPISVPVGYVFDLSFKVQGSTLLDKSDSCMVILFNQFDNELQGVELNYYSIITTSASNIVRYKQYVNNILIDDHGLWFEFDESETLIGIYMNMVLDSATNVILESLTSQAEAEKQKVVLKLNGYALINIQEVAEHAPPSTEGLADVSIEVSYPMYITGCKDVTISALISTEGPLRTMGQNGLAGLYANPVPGAVPTFNFPSNQTLSFPCGKVDCGEDASNRFEDLMCYYHLNYALAYINERLAVLGPATPSIVFNKYTDYEDDVPVVSITSVGNEVRFSGSCDNVNFNDVAEDSDHIVSAAFESYLVFNKLKVPIGQAHGVGAGTIAFWTWKYMNDRGYSHSAIGGFAGSSPTSILVNSTATFANIVPNQNRINASIWCSTLEDIFSDALGENEMQMNSILIELVRKWETTTNQPQAAGLLQNIAWSLTPTAISWEQYCSIEQILRQRGYGPFLMSYTRDLYIKDSHEDGNPDLPPGEDRGEEPNEASGVYDKSPQIWNCQDNSNCFQHERPDIGESNYIRVFVSNRGCEWDGVTGTLEVYAAFTAWNEQWPHDWGGDTNIPEDGIPNDAYYYFGNQWQLVGKRIAVTDLDENFIEDPEGNGRIYTLSWFPWSPWPTNKPWVPQHNYLARIVPGNDPITYTSHGSALQYTKENNNVARRKHSNTLYAQSFNPPPLTLSPVGIGSLLGDMVGIQEDYYLRFEYENPGFTLNDGNFDSLGTVQIIFPRNLLTTFGGQLPTGSGHSWINDSTLLITGAGFRLPLNLDVDTIYPLQILYTPIDSFRPVSFRMGLIDDNGCYYGGEHFDINTTGISPRSAEWETPVSRIKLHPNPVSDVFSIMLPGDMELNHITVYNLYGQVVFYSAEKTQRTYSMGNRPEGIYFTRVVTEDGNSETLPFIKVK